MQKVKDLFRFLKFIAQLKLLNKELNVISQIENSHCGKQKLIKKDYYKIAFIIGGMPKFSGGNTSILRLGTYLHKFGHEIYYVTYDNSKKKQMEKNAEINLPSYKGNFLEKNGLYDYKFDIAIATLWESCYHLLKYQDNFDYKFYFIQDFEPYFYAMGDLYFMAINTYKLGFHMISLGEWNKFKIEEIISKKVDYIKFPVEIDQYKLNKRKIKINKEVRIALYLKFDSRRAPFLLLQQIEYLHEKLSKLGYEVKIYTFGLNKLIKLPFIINLGKLKAEELRKLYKNSHFGLVASLTNISLVNYEMILSGLPVIDLADGSAPTFFSEDEMIFINSNNNDLFKKVLYYLDHQDELNKILTNSQSKIITNELTWENSSKQFNQIIQKERET